DFSNNGTVGIDFGASSGSTLTIGGTLTNASTGSLNIGYSGLTADSTVATADLSNTGNLIMIGSQTHSVTPSVLGAAPSTLTGDNYIANNAGLIYGSGSITTIDFGAVLDLEGNGRVGISGQAGNSALTHMTTNIGGLHLNTSVRLVTNPFFEN